MRRLTFTTYTPNMNRLLLRALVTAASIGLVVAGVTLAMHSDLARVIMAALGTMLCAYVVIMASVGVADEIHDTLTKPSPPYDQS